MAVTFAELKRRIRARTANKIDEVRADILLREKIGALWDSNDWSFRQKDAILTTAAPYTTGTVTLNADRTKVDGVGTAWTAAQVGYSFRHANDNTFYEVTAINVGTQQLTLATAYAGAVFTTAGYRLFQSVYSLAADFDQLITMSYWWMLSEGSATSIERYDGRRSFTSQMPMHFVYRGEDANGVAQIELSPVPATAIGLQYRYRSKPKVWVDTDIVPIREDVLVYGCACDALYLLAIEQPEKAAGWTAVADKYQAKELHAYNEFAWADAKVQGIQKAVRDEAWSGMVNDEYLASHDLFSPV